MTRSLPRVLFSCGVSLLTTGAAWAQIPLGPEFRVNTFTTSGQFAGTVASDAAGQFTVVWTSYTQDGDYGGIFARRYLASGTPVGSSEFRVNGFTPSSQRTPALASDPTGRLVVVWDSYGQDGDVSGIFGRRYDSAGTPGGEFQVNTYTTGNQAYPAVATDAAGNFVVVWQGELQDGSQTGVFAQRFNAGGTPQGAEFRVNTYTTSAQYHASVAMDSTGNFLVVWQSFFQDSSGTGVYAQRYDAAGVPQGAEFRVNSYVTGEQNHPSIAMSPTGEFVVAWTSYLLDGSLSEVFARRFSATAVPQGPEFRVNTYTTGQQAAPGVAMDAHGSFVVAWDSDDGGIYPDVFAREFDPAGAASGPEYRLNTYTTSSQTLARVALQPGGRFVVTWTSYLQDGNHFAQIARRFATDLIFQDGFESGTLGAWTSASTDAGDLSVSGAAAMKFSTSGLQGVVDDVASLFVQDDTPVDENLYRARFYFDTNGFDPGEASGARRTRIFIAFEEAPTRRLAAIVLKRQGGVYSVMGRARLDDGSQADTGFFGVTPGAHYVEMAWKRASGPSTNDGTFELWIDGTSQSLLTNLDNSLSAVDFVRLGALSVKNTANGTLFWDEFESRRTTYIGS